MACRMPTVSSPRMSGTSSSACSIWSSKSSWVNGSSVGDSADAAIDGMSSASMRIGRWAYEPTSRSPPCWRSYMFVSMSRTIGNLISPTVPANCGTGPTLIIWWTAGVSGIDAPAIRAMRGLQHAAGDDDRLGLDGALVGVDAPDAAVLDVDAGDLGAGGDRQRAELLRALAHDRARPQRVDDADVRGGEAAEDDRILEVRDLLLDLGRGEELGVDAPRHRRRRPPLQLLHPLGRAGDLDAAAPGEDAHLLVLDDAVEGERGHLLRVVGQEDEVRRVTGRAAGVRQRPLVEQDDVAPAETGEVPGHAVADDAGADDHDACAFGKPAHVPSLVVVRVRALLHDLQSCCGICDTLRHGRGGAQPPTLDRRRHRTRPDSEGAGRGARSPSVERVAAALELVADQGWVTAADLASAMGVDRSTGWRLARSLEQVGWLRQDPATGRYRLGIRLFELGTRVLDTIDVRDEARRVMTELVASTGESVDLAIRDGDSVVFIDKIDGTHEVRAFTRSGQRARAPCDRRRQGVPGLDARRRCAVVPRRATRRVHAGDEHRPGFAARGHRGDAAPRLCDQPRRVASRGRRAGRPGAGRVGGRVSRPSGLTCPSRDSTTTGFASSSPSSMAATKRLTPSFGFEVLASS